MKTTHFLKLAFTLTVFISANSLAQNTKQTSRAVRSSDKVAAMAADSSKKGRAENRGVEISINKEIAANGPKEESVKTKGDNSKKQDIPPTSRIDQLSNGENIDKPKMNYNQVKARETKRVMTDSTKSSANVVLKGKKIHENQRITYSWKSGFSKNAGSERDSRKAFRSALSSSES